MEQPERRRLNLDNPSDDDVLPLNQLQTDDGKPDSTHDEPSPELELIGHIEPSPVIPEGQMMVPFPFNEWALTCTAAVVSVTTQSIQS